MTSQSAPTGRPAPDRSWLSIGPASRLLGVDQDTLRRWADEGRIDAFTTPGGHRRFDRAVVDRLVAGRRSGVRPLASMGATPERLSRVYQRSYTATDASADQVRTAVGDADREVYRQEGRRLVTRPRRAPGRRSSTTSRAAPAPRPTRRISSTTWPVGWPPRARA